MSMIICRMYDIAVKRCSSSCLPTDPRYYYRNTVPASLCYSHLVTDCKVSFYHFSGLHYGRCHITDLSFYCNCGDILYTWFLCSKSLYSKSGFITFALFLFFKEKGMDWAVWRYSHRQYVHVRYTTLVLPGQLNVLPRWTHLASQPLLIVNDKFSYLLCSNNLESSGLPVMYSTVSLGRDCTNTDPRCSL